MAAGPDPAASPDADSGVDPDVDPIGDLAVEVIRRAGPQDHLLFLIHGYGEPPAMLTAHLDRIDPAGRFVVVTPLGPFDKKGKAIWHRALGGESEQAAAQFRASRAALARCLHAQVAALGLPADRVVVGGFSQGAGLAIALLLCPELDPPPAACLAFCGFVPPVPGLTVDLARARGVPLFLSIADDDVFVPLDASRSSAACLADMGFDVRFHELHCRHEITPEAATLAGAWLDDLVAAVRPLGARGGSGDPITADGGGMRDFAQSLWVTA